MSDCELDCRCQPGVEVGIVAPHVEVELPAVNVPESKPKGRLEKAVVSSTAPVARDEFIHKELEYISRGEPVRWVLEDANVLATAELSDNRVGVVFTQNDETKFKILSVTDEGELLLGNTLPILDDQALDEAVLVELEHNRAAILYNRDGDGVAAVVRLNDRHATLDYVDDIWLDGGDPTNLTACVLSSGWLMVSTTLREQAARDGGQPGECWVWGFKENTAKTSLVGGWLTGRRVDGNNDTDSYSGAWSLAAVDAYTAVLCFPQALDRPVGFAVLDVDSPHSGEGNISVRLIGEGKFANTLPTIGAIGLDGGRWFMAYGCCYLTGKEVTKSFIGYEMWGLSRYAAEQLWYAWDDVRYKGGIGGVAVSSALFGAAVTYTSVEPDSAATGRENAVNHAKAVYFGTAGGPAPGVPVLLPSNSGYIRVVPVTVTKAIMVYVADGSAWAQAMELEERVIPVTDIAAKEKNREHLEGYIDGYAVTGGEPNATISIREP